MSNNTIILILVEGETEQHLINDSNIRGKVKIFNCWDNEIKKIQRMINSKYHVVIVYDTDIINPACTKRFKENITVLSKICHQITILQQTQNLEDELIYACSCSEKSLLNEFKSSSKSEFKSSFLKCTNPLVKLEKLGFDSNKMWDRDIIKEFENLINVKTVNNKNIW